VDVVTGVALEVNGNFFNWRGPAGLAVGDSESVNALFADEFTGKDALNDGEREFDAFNGE